MRFSLIEKVYATTPTPDYILQPGGSPGFTSVSKGLFGSLGSVFDYIFSVLFLVAGALAIIYLLWSGIQYIISAGNAERVKSARSGIINAIIGIVVIIATYAIVRFAVSIGNTVTDIFT